jgi:hypothetical protein
MKRRIWVARLLRWSSLLVFVAPGFAAQAPVPQPNEEVEASLLLLKPPKAAAQIDEHQRALDREIADARRGPHQGDTFELSRQFLRIIHGEFQGPQAQLARKTIRPEDPSSFIVRLHVNDVYPRTLALTTSPPTLLSELTQLPPKLVYRITGRALSLEDTKAGLIVDLIPNAIP